MLIIFESNIINRHGDSRRKMSENGNNGVNVSNGVQPIIDDAEDLEKKELELKRKQRDPPIVFADTINVSQNDSIIRILHLLAPLSWDTIGASRKLK